MTRQLSNLAIAVTIPWSLFGCNNDPPPAQPAAPPVVTTPKVKVQGLELTPEQVAVKERKVRQYNANEELKNLGIRVMRDSNDADESLNLRLAADDVITDSAFEPLSKLKELRGLTIQFG